MRKRFSIAVPGRAVSLAATLAALSFLAGCKPVGPNYTRPPFTAPPVYKEGGAPSVTVPPPNPDGGSWKPATPSDGMLKGKWWEIYNDPQLNALEERIAGNNQAVRQAMENYLAARDQVQSVRSQLYPRISAGPGYSYNRVSHNEPNATPATKTSYNDLLLTGAGSWEPDFWGKIRRGIEAAHANMQASAAEQANLSLSLEAEMAADYFQMRGLDSQIQLLKKTVGDLEKQLDLTQRRLKGGVATDVDVAQAQTQLETVKAQLVDVSVGRAQFEHAIGTIANYTLSSFSIPYSPLDLSLPNVPLGVPSQLLERRPDIAAAERQAQAANAQIGVQISAYYPTINLNGVGGFESTHGGTWISGPSALWSLGASAAELLFDAGQRRALTDQARHQYEAQAAGYRNTVFTAFQDVEDNLSTLRTLNEEEAVEKRAVDSAQHSLDLSNQRYKGGVTSYLEVLTAETTLLADQRILTDLQTRQFAFSVQLVRSLGGGWDDSQLPK
ncbi:efflux transporter outer membrane subunit [Terracidiphilus gabretensis]|jgi:NodT family efflux transporter outer membrane factor (OMF) lipoprotein|uniref:efflux transporter outer membrane subunit n=1 Tax=Terracidiphilus gabretensis TaxID=1577687 RepID=UPI00071C0BA7|nr:efflux transporter outer membrane subunit [Terracidiphilus gabretensis]